MAITILNNLYPPLIRDSYMPAFIYNQSCKIYFSLSEYNSINQLATQVPVQVTVRDVKTNKTVLSSDLYPSGIKLCNMMEETSLTENSKYYIQISSGDIQDGFKLNEYYQVQLRFTGRGATTPPGTGIGIDKWLSQNLSYFSQWSTIVLIYGISTPTLNLKHYRTSSYNTNTDSSAKAVVAGTITFNKSEDKETLKSYKIIVRDGTNSSGTILEESKTLYPNDYDTRNELFYSIKYNLLKYHYYRIEILMQTKNLYSFSNYFIYRWSPSSANKFNIEHQIIADDENGSIRVRLGSKYRPQDYQPRYVYEKEPTNRVTGQTLYLTVTNNINNRADFSSAVYVSNKDKMFLINVPSTSINNDLSKGVKVIIKRSSSRDNFNIWEDFTSITITEDYVMELIWDDYTVEPGVWYKYKVIRDFDEQAFSSEFDTDPKMVYTDHIFLTADNKQLAIKFDPQINNFSIKTSQSLVETIGSQYPFIKREGNIFYKTFSLSGTISYLSDIDSNLFHSSKDELYLNNNIAKLYNDYNKENNIGMYKDFVREKEFRNAVIDFLYKDNVKLFRSLTEGNLLVKLMNITLTPNSSLGRMIYSFSCTVCEIDQPTVENFDNYNTFLTKEYEYT